MIPPHFMPACDEEITTSAAKSTFRCSAFTTISAAARLPEMFVELICSLITSDPTISGIVWFGWPVTLIEIPFTVKAAMVELPAADACPGWQEAVAFDANTDAVT